MLFRSIPLPQTLECRFGVVFFVEFRRMFLFYSFSLEWFDVLLHQAATINVRRLTAFLVPVCVIIFI